MGDMTKNISRHEIACRCQCGLDAMDYTTIKVVQATCDHYAKVMNIKKVVVTITSGCRCLDYNDSIGSSSVSQHPKCKAIDFVISGVNPYLVYEYLNDKYPNQYGIGKYADFTHFDSRDIKARW